MLRKQWVKCEKLAFAVGLALALLLAWLWGLLARRSAPGGAQAFAPDEVYRSEAEGANTSYACIYQRDPLR